MNTEIEFKLSGGLQPLILVPTQVNDRGPYQFILDTGAGISLLTPELAQELSLTAQEASHGIGAGGKIEVFLSNVDSLKIGHSEAREINVAITPELHKISAVIGEKVEGNIGYNYLKNFLVTIDYQKKLMSLTTVSQQTEPSSTLASTAGIKFRLAQASRPLIVVPTMVNGAGPFQFVLDTGASSTVISQDLAHQLGIESGTTTDITAAGGKIAVMLGELDSLLIGQARMNNLAVVIGDFLNMISQLVATKLDGIIGYNFLQQFRVSIDYVNEFIYLA